MADRTAYLMGAWEQRKEKEGKMWPLRTHPSVVFPQEAPPPTLYPPPIVYSLGPPAPMRRPQLCVLLVS